MSLWTKVVAMNAFLYVVPIYCVVRAVSDFRAGRKIWAVFGAISGGVLLGPLLVVYVFPISEATAWSILGFVMFGSMEVAIYVISRTSRDVVDGRYWWALAGGLGLILLVVPWLRMFFIPGNAMTIG